MTNKHLDARGKGEVDYDYKDDTLFFKIKNRDYDHSIDFEDFVVDIDKEGYITGIQVFGASELFKLPKLALNNIKYMEFDARAENNIIKLRLLFRCMLRNREIVQAGENLERESTSPLQDKAVLCSVEA